MIEREPSPSRTTLLLGSMVALAAAVGALIPAYIGFMGEGLVRMVALPAALALGFLFLFSRRLLFLLVIFFRAVCGPLFEATRIGAGAMGLGGLANALVISMAVLFWFERPRAISRTALPMWAPLIVVAAFGALRAPELAAGVKYLLVYMSYAAVFAVPFYLKECRSGIAFAVRFLLLSSLLPAFFGFLDFAQGGGGGVLAGRISSTFEHPNIFAFYLVFMVSLALYLLKSEIEPATPAQRVMLVAYIAVLLVLLLLTKTRSAWAACVVVFAVYGLLFERRFLVYLVVGGGLLLLVPAVQDRLLDLTQGNEQVLFGRLNSYAWRKSIWEAGLAWMRWHDMPLGYGLESFRYYSPVFFPAAGMLQAGAHSVYVQWFFEAGVIGVLCSTWLFWRLFRMLKAGYRKDRLGAVIVITIVVEYLVMSYSDNMLAYLSFNWYFWFLMGAACASWGPQEQRDRTGGPMQSNQPDSVKGVFP